MLVVVCLAMVVVVVVPRWWQRDHDLMTVDQDRPFRQAEAWIAANVPYQARLLVDDPSGSTSSNAATRRAR